MKKNYLQIVSFLIIVLTIFSCNTPSENLKFKIANNAKFDIENAQIVIPISEISELLETKTENQTIAIKNSVNKFIPFQIDTLSENNIEIAFVIDLKANESAEISISLVPDSSSTKFQQFTNIRLGKDSDFDGNFEDIKEETRDTSHKPQASPILYQMEGIAWENDKVGFRTYWDSRNGKDIFGKLIETPVLDTAGIGSSKSYHVINNWGMDILKVGSSLGAGSIAVSKNDSLYRLGETKSAHFKLVTEGPIRAIMDLEYKGWIIDGKEYSLQERISIWKGKYYYNSKLKLNGETDGLDLVTGITNLHTDTFYTSESNNYKVLYTHDLQSENNDTLGMAILINNDIFKEFAVSPNENTNVSHTYYTKMKISKETEFYFVSAWEKSNSEFSKKSGFENYIKTITQELNNTISIKKIK